MKKLIFPLVAVVVACSFAAEKNADTPAKRAKLSPEERKAKVEAAVLKDMIENGGTCEVPGMQKGKIRIVNSQKRLPKEGLDKFFVEFVNRLYYDTAWIEGEPVTPYNAEDARKKIGADLAVFLVDDPKLGVLLTAPEGRWAIVNIAKLAYDNPKPAFLSARATKETLRAIGYMTAETPYASRIMTPINSPSDLDEIANVRFPIDVVMRMHKYLSEIGVTRREWDTYRNIIAGGYEVAPTNQYQKAIYDEEKAKRKQSQSK